MLRCSRTCWVIGTFVFIYFIVYPTDLAVLLQPLVVLAGIVIDTAGTILQLSNTISPWLYVTVIAGLACWTVTRMWNKNPRPPAKKKTRARA